MKFDMTFSHLVRYALTGGIAIVLYGLRSFDIDRLTTMEPTAGGVSALVALAVLVGLTVQVSHRALWYPPILRLIHWSFNRSFAKDLGYGCPYWNPYVQTPFEFDMDRARWERKGKAVTIQASLDAWGDQIHFLYASAWSALLAWAAAGIVWSEPGGVATAWLVAVAGFFAAAAVMHDVRQTRVEVLVFASERSIDLRQELPGEPAAMG